MPRYFTSAPHFTHAQMRNKVYFGRPRTILITSFSSSRGLADSHAPRLSAVNFLRPRKSSWWYCACVEVVRPHSSAAEYTLNAAQTWLCARRNGTERGKWSIPWPLGFSSDSKTKPASKLNCRVMIVMSRVQKETSFRHLLEQLRAMNEHDETAPAAFRFLYSTLSKHMDAYSSSLLL